MKNFIFKSTSADLQKILQSIDGRLDVAMKNVLYLTHQVDFIRKKIVELTTDKSLQKQVDEYFEDDVPEDTTQDQEKET